MCFLTRRWSWLLAFLLATPAQAQSIELHARPSYFMDYMTLLQKEVSAIEASLTAPTKTARLQMFRMPTGFMATPLSLVEDDESFADPLAKTADDWNILQITYGNHVPYLDMPRRDDPGGFGYHKIYSQLQLLDAGPTNVGLALNAVTPMGAQYGGANGGKTYFSPSLACFHDLGDGAAIHAFVGQQLEMNSQLRNQVQTGFRCGLAVQHPVPFASYGPDQGLFVFVQALGQYRSDSTRPDVRSTTWDVIPGIHYRLNNACWMSMGFSRYQFLSCVWQY